MAVLLEALHKLEGEMGYVRPKDLLELLRRLGEPTGDFYKRLTYARFKGYITPIKTRRKVKYIFLSNLGLGYLRKKGVIQSSESQFKELLSFKKDSQV